MTRRALTFALLGLACTKPNPLFLGEATTGGSGGGSGSGALSDGGGSTSSTSSGATTAPTSSVGLSATTGDGTTVDTTGVAASSGSTGPPATCPEASTPLILGLHDDDAPVQDLAVFDCQVPVDLVKTFLVEGVEPNAIHLKDCGGACDCPMVLATYTLKLSFPGNAGFLDGLPSCVGMRLGGAVPLDSPAMKCGYATLELYKNALFNTAPILIAHRDTSLLHSLVAPPLYVDVSPLPDEENGCASNAVCSPLQGNHKMAFSLKKNDSMNPTEAKIAVGAAAPALVASPTGDLNLEIHNIRGFVRDPDCGQVSEWALRQTQ